MNGIYVIIVIVLIIVFVLVFIGMFRRRSKNDSRGSSDSSQSSSDSGAHDHHHVHAAKGAPQYQVMTGRSKTAKESDLQKSEKVEAPNTADEASQKAADSQETPDEYPRTLAKASRPRVSTAAAPVQSPHVSTPRVLTSASAQQENVQSARIQVTHGFVEQSGPRSKQIAPNQIDHVAAREVSHGFVEQPAPRSKQFAPRVVEHVFVEQTAPKANYVSFQGQAPEAEPVATEIQSVTFEHQQEQQSVAVEAAADNIETVYVRHIAELFSPKEDVLGEFGVTPEQLNEMVSNQRQRMVHQERKLPINRHFNMDNYKASKETIRRSSIPEKGHGSKKGKITQQIYKQYGRNFTSMSVDGKRGAKGSHANVMAKNVAPEQHQQAVQASAGRSSQAYLVNR